MTKQQITPNRADSSRGTNQLAASTGRFFISSNTSPGVAKTFTRRAATEVEGATTDSGTADGGLGAFSIDDRDSPARPGWELAGLLELDVIRRRIQSQGIVRDPGNIAGDGSQAPEERRVYRTRHRKNPFPFSSGASI
jgi:hypothetical protein